MRLLFHRPEAARPANPIKPGAFFVTAFIIVLAVPVSPANAENPQDFRYEAPIEGKFQPNLPAKVRLPASLIAGTSNALADLRVFDDNGSEVPYVLYGKDVPRRKKNRTDCAADGREREKDDLGNKEVSGIGNLTDATASSPQAYGHLILATTAVEVDSEGATLIDPGLVNLPLVSLTFGIKNLYYCRMVEVSDSDSPSDRRYRKVAEGRILNSPETASPETTIALPPRWSRYLHIRILNEDNPPLEIEKVDIAWVPQYLYFFPQEGRSYRCYCGSEYVRGPRYETGKIIPPECARRERFQELSVGPVRRNPDYRPGPTVSTKMRIEQGILIATVLVLICALGVWGFSLVRRLPVEPVESDGDCDRD